MLCIIFDFGFGMMDSIGWLDTVYVELLVVDLFFFSRIYNIA
jgi:hypothetical protein